MDREQEISSYRYSTLKTPTQTWWVRLHRPVLQLMRKKLPFHLNQILKYNGNFRFLKNRAERKHLRPVLGLIWISWIKTQTMKLLSKAKKIKSRKELIIIRWSLSLNRSYAKKNRTKSTNYSQPRVQSPKIAPTQTIIINTSWFLTRRKFGVFLWRLLASRLSWWLSIWVSASHDSCSQIGTHSSSPSQHSCATLTNNDRLCSFNRAKLSSSLRWSLRVAMSKQTVDMRFGWVKRTKSNSTAFCKMSGKCLKKCVPSTLQEKRVVHQGEFFLSKISPYCNFTQQWLAWRNLLQTKMTNQKAVKMKII